MGEMRYCIDDNVITWPEDDDGEFPCLCTFPLSRKGLDEETVRSLALLGAAVVLARQGLFDDEWVFIPESLPQWIVDGVRDIVMMGAE